MAKTILKISFIFTLIFFGGCGTDTTFDKIASAVQYEQAVIISNPSSGEWEMNLVAGDPQGDVPIEGLYNVNLSYIYITLPQSITVVNPPTNYTGGDTIQLALGSDLTCIYNLPIVGSEGVVSSYSLNYCETPDDTPVTLDTNNDPIQINQGQSIILNIVPNLSGPAIAVAAQAQFLLPLVLERPLMMIRNNKLVGV